MQGRHRLPDGSKSMQVLETGGDKVASETEGEHLLVPRKRPVSVTGVTDRARTGHGNLFVTVNFDDEGHPFELFTTLGKAGGCDSAYLEAISRLASLALRSGIDPSQVVEQLRGITCDPIWDEGTLVRSAPDAVSLVLNKHLEGEGQKRIVADDVQPATRVSQLGLFPSTKDEAAMTNGHMLPSGARCPECSGYLIHQGAACAVLTAVTTSASNVIVVAGVGSVQLPWFCPTHPPSKDSWGIPPDPRQRGESPSGLPPLRGLSTESYCVSVPPTRPI